LFDKPNKYATLLYKDPVGRGNAYRYIQYVNEVKEKTIFVRDDDLTDGRTIERVLFFFYDDEDEDKKKLKKGDVVKVEMLGIDYPIYKYWYSLAQSSTGENQSATPGNPVTNMKGGALGYFSAHTIQSKTVTVP
jgi:ribosomal protein S1